MKNNMLARLLLFAVFSAAPALHAADTVEVPWNSLCRTAAGRQLDITTSKGETFSGYCISINANEVGINTGAKIVKLGRAALSQVQTKIQMDRSKGGQLRTLGRGVRTGLKNGFNWLLSPAAIGGIVTIPATLAWGAVSAPFCALGDLKHELLGKQEVKLI